MKKVKVILSLLFAFSVLIATNARAQTGAEYFEGKWNVLVKGTPSGDAKMVVSLLKLDTTLTGAILDTAGTEIAKISKVELKGNSATVYFSAQGYDVFLLLTKKDDNQVTGSMMDMFDAEGERAKKQ